MQVRMSQSHKDVADVAKSSGPRPRWLETHEVVRSTKASSQSACQEHENEPAEVVLVCEPEGTSLMMGGLHPRYAPTSYEPSSRGVTF